MGQTPFALMPLPAASFAMDCEKICIDGNSEQEDRGDKLVSDNDMKRIGYVTMTMCGEGMIT
jgi:hypothetical protein